MKSEIKQEIESYRELHTRPCGFLEDLLRGHHGRARNHADAENSRDFEEIEAYIGYVLPAESHGTDKKFEQWLNSAPGERRVVGDGLKTIYCFVEKGSEPTMLPALAICEDGHFFGGTVSSSIGWAKHDLGITSDWCPNDYLAHCPTGFTLVWIDMDRNEIDDDFLAAFEKAGRALQRQLTESAL